MKAKTRFACVCIICAMLVGVAAATPITFIYTGTGSGTLGSVPFTASSYVITSQGDTENRQNFEIRDTTGWFIDHSASSIAITGLGTFDVLTGTRTFVNNTNLTVGYSRANGGDLFDGPIDTVFGTWDMLGPIGPISGTGSLDQWGSGDIDTTGGILIFADGTPNAVFTAIPEPATMCLLGLGALGMLRKRKTV